MIGQGGRGLSSRNDVVNEEAANEGLRKKAMSELRRMRLPAITPFFHGGR